MEKSTKKFLSILLCIAMLMSFPIVANANQAYDETFNGTYVAPSSTKNYLISGDEASLTEWYGERVKTNKGVYSVRQNQYGLNEDGNIIEAKQQTKYTLWLAQYGVATLKFVVPEDGQYVITTSRNEIYSNDNKPDDLGIEKERRNLSASLGVYDDKYNNVETESSYLTDKTDNTKFSNVLTKKCSKGEVLYIAAGATFCGVGYNISKDFCEGDSYFAWNITSSPNDMIYDVEIINKEDMDLKNCKHNISSYISEEKNSCIVTETRKCELCGENFTIEYENHSFKWFEIKVPEEAKCWEKQTTTHGYRCSCGVVSKTDTYTQYGRHARIKNLKLVDPNDEFVKEYWSHNKNGDVDGGQEAIYEGDCIDCKSHIVGFYGKSPCFDEDGNIKHDFGVDERSIDCKNPVTCKKCGYIAAPHKNYVVSDKKEPYKNTKCVHTYSKKCGICDKHYINYRVTHKNIRYVQVTPQHDNVCGTYKFHCDECDEDMTSVLTCHSYYTVKNADGTYTKKCARCGEVADRDYTNMGNPGGSTGGNQGGSSGGNQGGSSGGNQGGSSGGGDAPAPAPTPEPGTSDNNANNNTTTSNNNSSTQNQPKLKKIVVNKVKAQKKAVVVAWKAVKNITGYQIQLATDKKFKKNKKTVTVKNKKATKKTVKKLKSKKKYYVRVRAYKTQNGKRTYSSWSKTKSFKTK